MNTQDDWEKYGNFLTPDQYRNFTDHRNQALKKLKESRDSPVIAKTSREIDQRHALKNQEESSLGRLTVPAHEAIYEEWRKFEELSHGLLEPRIVTGKQIGRAHV